MDTLPASVPACGFRVTTDADGNPVVIVDGHDITRSLRGYQVIAAPGDIPHVVLHLNPARALPVELDTLARVAVGEEPDPGPATARFLAAMDPAELERAALNRDDLGNGPNAIAAAMLRQLMDWASGRI